MTTKSPPKRDREALIRDAFARLFGRPFHDPITAMLLGQTHAPSFTDLPTFAKLADFRAEIDRLKRAEEAGAQFREALRALGPDALARFDAEARAERSDGATEAGRLSDQLSINGLCSSTAVGTAIIAWMAASRRISLENEAAAMASLTAGKGRPPGDLRADWIARQLAAFYLRERGEPPKASFGGGEGKPSNAFSRAVEAIFEACGVEVGPKGPTERACTWAAEHHRNAAS